MGITGGFNLATGFASTGLSGMSMGAASSLATPKTSILGAIAPQAAINAKSAAAVQKPEVSGNQAGAKAAAQDAQKGLAGAKQDVDRAKASVGEAVQQAKREIAAAAQANGAEAGGVFPNTQMAGSEAELVIGAVGDVSMGSGTMAQLASGALKASSGMSIAADVSAGMQGKPAAEVKAAIQDTLTAGQPEQGFGLIQTVQTAQAMDNAPSIDWAAAFEANPNVLDEIMYCDPNNPSAAFPEMIALNDAGVMIEKSMAEMAPIANSYEPPYCAAGIAACGELPPAAMVAAAPAMESFKLAAMGLSGAAADAVIPKADLENALAELANSPNAPVVPASSMSV